MSLDIYDLLLPGVVLSVGALIGVFFFLKDTWKQLFCDHFYTWNNNLQRFQCEKCEHVYIEERGRTWH
jgi:hypothetical protein